MKNVTALIVAGFVIATAFGCGKAKQYVIKFADLEKKTCACADKACAENALKELLALIVDKDKSRTTDSDADGKKIGMSTANIVKCLMAKGVSPLTIQQEVKKIK